jgi:hypothetical protein
VRDVVERRLLSKGQSVGPGFVAMLRGRITARGAKDAKEFRHDLCGLLCESGRKDAREVG